MNIAIFGWYHHQNAGDDRMQQCITRWLDGHCLAFLPAGRPPPIALLRTYDAIILGGGSIVNPDGGMFRDISRWVRKVGIPVGIVSVTLDEISPAFRAEFRRFLDLDLCCFAWFRDQESADLVGPHPKVFAAPDITWLFPFGGAKQTIDHRPQTMDLPPASVGGREQTIDHRPQTLDHGPQTIDHEQSPERSERGDCLTSGPQGQPRHFVPGSDIQGADVPGTDQSPERSERGGCAEPAPSLPAAAAFVPGSDVPPTDAPVQGPGSRVPGPSSAVPGPWSMVHGASSPVQGPGSMVKGLCPPPSSLRPQPSLCASANLQSTIGTRQSSVPFPVAVCLRKQRGFPVERWRRVLAELAAQGHELLPWPLYFENGGDADVLGQVLGPESMVYGPGSKADGRGSEAGDEELPGTGERIASPACASPVHDSRFIIHDSPLGSAGEANGEPRLASTVHRSPFTVHHFPFPTEFSLDPVRRAAAVISGRFHGILFALQMGRPVIAVSSLPKTRRFLAENGIERWCVSEDTPEKLLELWPQFREQLPALTQRALAVASRLRTEAAGPGTRARTALLAAAGRLAPPNRRLRNRVCDVLNVGRWL